MRTRVSTGDEATGDLDSRLALKTTAVFKLGWEQPTRAGSCCTQPKSATACPGRVQQRARAGSDKVPPEYSVHASRRTRGMDIVQLEGRPVARERPAA